MILLAIGCSYQNTPVEVRERLALGGDRLAAALEELETRYGCEAVILSTCNRVEVYLARTESDRAPRADLLAEFLGELHGLPGEQIRPHLYEHAGAAAVRHLFRVAGSLDSMIVGEGQIAGQVREAYETAVLHDAVGPYLHALFQHALKVSGRVRSETGIARGHVSVSSAAVDYVRQVFSHFGDKTVLVIGAGKMGVLTLKHIRELHPREVLVTNRSPEKAAAVAAGCGGRPVPWDRLDETLAQADIVVSTTGAPEPIMTLARWKKVLARRRTSEPVVVFDIAVPRDFDQRIHDGERTCLFNVDDLKRLQQERLADRLRHVGAAEAIIDQEVDKFQREWAGRQNGPVIARLTADFEQKRREVVANLFKKLNGKLTEGDRQYIEGAFRLFQNKLLHGPVSTLREESPEGSHKHTLLEAMLKLFRLQE